MILTTTMLARIVIEYHFNTKMYRRSELHLVGEVAGYQVVFDIYEQVRRTWGALTLKRLEALERTRPTQLTLHGTELDPDELGVWILDAAQYHRKMKSDWVQTAKERWISGYHNLEYSRVYKSKVKLDFTVDRPQRKKTKKSLLVPEPPLRYKGQSTNNPSRRMGTCQICDKLKLKRELKGVANLKRVCRSCRKTLYLV